jgi:hypothetical protein
MSVSLSELCKSFTKLGTIFSVKLNPGIAMHANNDVTDAAKLKILVVLNSAFHVYDEPASLNSL